MKLEDATVLLVDDELELLEIFARWLGRAGCTVLTAVNGVEALRVLSTARVDVLVSDIQMPVMGGLALVRHIYEGKTMVPSIVFVSGCGDVPPREMYALGVEALIEKPLHRKTLVDALEASLTDRMEMWLAPEVGPIAKTVAIDIVSFEGIVSSNDISDGCSFRLGHGGCYFTSTQSLLERETIDLTVHSAREDLTLNAQGRVYWYDRAAGCAGMAFRYLDPECRGWVIDSINRTMPRSFIPRC